MKRRNTHRFHSQKTPALCFGGLRPRTAEFWAKEEGGGIHLWPLKASDPRQPKLKPLAKDTHFYLQARVPFMVSSVLCLSLKYICVCWYLLLIIIKYSFYENLRTYRTEENKSNPYHQECILYNTYKNYALIFNIY